MKKIVVTSLVAVLLTGCSFVPEYQRPQAPMPAEWSQPGAGTAQMARSWWESFGDAELSRLMAIALDQNLDIRAALHRVDQSRALLKISGASLLPSVDATSSASRTRTNPDSGRTTTETDLRAGLGISYELDLFGANRASVEGAQADYAGSQFDRDAVALVVMGDVATTYFNVLNARQRLTIADANLKNARDVLKIVDARYQAGTVSALDLAQQEASLAATQAVRATTAQNVSVAENALAVLLGQVPQTLEISGDSLKDMKVPAIDPGQPSALLERRPDIRKSEMDLIAANADIGVARAAFFPTVTLGLDGSIAAAGFGDPATTALGLASALAAPIFQGGRLEGGVEQATARQKELVENYRKTVLVSLQEVENALTAEKTAASREGHLAKAMQESRKAYKYARQQYEAGVIDFQTLLETQTAQLLAEDSHAQSRNERLQASIDLFKALGGGWAIPEKM